MIADCGRLWRSLALLDLVAEAKKIPMKLSNRHLKELETAEFLGLELATVRDWRVRKIGPTYCKFGRSVRYPLDELLKFAEHSRVQTQNAA